MVFSVQTGCEPIDRNLMELLFHDPSAKAPPSAKRITAVHSRSTRMPVQDRKAKPREPISARLVPTCSSSPAPKPRADHGSGHQARSRASSPSRRPHGPRCPLFARAIPRSRADGENVVFVSPDAGRAKQSRSASRDARRRISHSCTSSRAGGHDSSSDGGHRSRFREQDPRSSAMDVIMTRDDPRECEGA